MRGGRFSSLSSGTPYAFPFPAPFLALNCFRSARPEVFRRRALFLLRPRAAAPSRQRRRAYIHRSRTSPLPTCTLIFARVRPFSPRGILSAAFFPIQLSFQKLPPQPFHDPPALFSYGLYTTPIRRPSRNVPPLFRACSNAVSRLSRPQPLCFAALFWALIVGKCPQRRQKTAIRAGKRQKLAFAENFLHCLFLCGMR